MRSVLPGNSQYNHPQQAMEQVEHHNVADEGQDGEYVPNIQLQRQHPVQTNDNTTLFPVTISSERRGRLFPFQSTPCRGDHLVWLILPVWVDNHTLQVSSSQLRN